MLPTTAHTSAPPLRTVVVADDDVNTRLFIRTALEADGWTVHEAVDGAEACDLVERIEPNAALLDVGMPEMNGFEACARLRGLRSGRHIPVMMLTSLDDQESIDQAYEVGATDFLSKPFNYRILTQRLRYMYRAEQDARALRSERDFVSAVVDNSAALVLILDPHGRILRFNESCERVSGYSRDDVAGKAFWDVLTDPAARDRERVAFERLIAERGRSHYEGIWTAKDGSQREIAWSNSVLLNRDGDVEHVVGTGLDITERNEAEEKVRFLASYDPLTGLPNRQLVTEQLKEDVAAAGGRHLAILILNLDRFKHVNATLGHRGGDMLLVEVADRLAKSLRLSHALTPHNPNLSTKLGRRGGDEFIALLNGVAGATEVVAIIERLQCALRRPFKCGDQEFRITASIGAALFPADGADSETLMANAESATHSARKERRGNCHFYSVAAHSGVSELLSLEAELSQAVERGELEIHYQPKALTRSGELGGAEALVRWNHPSRGLLAPTAFIDVAEDAGLIESIGEWVLRQACAQVTSWLEAGLQVVPVAVNLSPAQFHSSDLVDRIASILNDTNLDPRYLTIEVTESAIMRDTQEAHDILCRLEALGIRVSIDDFGTGYSTLGWLKDLTVSQLKIDRAFVIDLAESAKDVAITRAIITMAHGLGMTVVAEGVESEEQLAILRDEGCDEVQGYLIGRPIPCDQFARLLDQRKGPGEASHLRAEPPTATLIPT